MRTVMLAAAAIVLLVGCGTETVAGPGADGRLISTRIDPVGCPDPAALQGGMPPDGSLGPVAADFTPTAVLMCTIEYRDFPGEGQWSVLVEQRADSGLDSFVAELRKPSDATGRGPCAAYGVVTPWFALIDSGGHAVRVALPTDECGRPRQSVLDALRSLPFTTVHEQRIAQVTSAAAQAAGCAMAWKDILAFEVEEGTARPAAALPVFAPAPSSLKVCVYSVDPQQAEQPAVGTFRSGANVTGASLAAVLTGLEATGPAGACAEKHPAFAVLLAGGAAGGPVAYAEMGGCERILTEGHELRQATPALTAALTAALG